MKLRKDNIWLYLANRLVVENKNIFIENLSFEKFGKVHFLRLTIRLHIQTMGKLPGQATQALLALFTLSLLITFTVCLNILYFNYFKGFFHTFICVFMNLLTSRRWVWGRGMLSSPLQAEDTPACKTIENRNYLLYCEQGLGEWGKEPNRSKCKRRSYSFSTRILTKLFELKEEVFWRNESGRHRSFAETRESISSQWWRYNENMFL